MPGIEPPCTAAPPRQARPSTNVFVSPCPERPPCHAGFAATRLTPSSFVSELYDDPGPPARRRSSRAQTVSRHRHERCLRLRLRQCGPAHAGSFSHLKPIPHAHSLTDASCSDVWAPSEDVLVLGSVEEDSGWKDASSSLASEDNAADAEEEPPSLPFAARRPPLLALAPRKSGVEAAVMISGIE